MINLLSLQASGTYLVRFSLSHPDSLALEYVEDTGAIRSVLIKGNMPQGKKKKKAAR